MTSQPARTRRPPTWHSPARWPAAIVLLCVAAAHAPLTPQHLSEAPYIGVGFVALSLACVGLAAILTVADQPLAWLASGVINGLAATAYVLSRSIALPQIGDDVGNWAEPLGVAAVVAETISVLIAASVLLRRVPRLWLLWALSATTVLVTAGCSTATTTADDHMHTMADGSHMSDSAMSKPSPAAGPGPSPAARMICSDEIRDTIARTFDLAEPPRSTSSWSHHVYACNYQLPDGTLRLTVHDAINPAAGTTNFARTSDRLDATPINGMQNFGLPAVQTTNGNTVFLKDGKTLRVDASRVPTTSLPGGYTRQEAAYSIAAAVIACWSE